MEHCLRELGESIKAILRERVWFVGMFGHEYSISDEINRAKGPGS